MLAAVVLKLELMEVHVLIHAKKVAFHLFSLVVVVLFHSVMELKSFFTVMEVLLVNMMTK